MSGVYIKGMEMPTEGGTICVYKISGKFFAARAGKDELFPIIPIQEPHGRLIDANEFLKRAIGTKCFRGDFALMLEELVGESTTVIPASGTEAE